MAIDPAILLAAIGSAIATIAGAGVKGVWVFGHQLRQTQDALEAMTRDRDFWRDRAWKSAHVGDVAVDVAESKAKPDGA